jgi:hypothetical protein
MNAALPVGNTNANFCNMNKKITRGIFCRQIWIFPGKDEQTAIKLLMKLYDF